MKLDDAIAVACQLQRYRYRNCVAHNSRGAYVRNIFVPHATARQFKQAVDAEKNPCGKIVWVEIDALCGLQKCLGLSRLLRQLRHHPLKKLPVIVKLSRGRYYLWDGNHRVSAAVLLGKRRVKCLLVGQIKA